MTPAEYADYERRFAAGVDGLKHFSAGFLRECGECRERGGGEEFSSEPCGICSRRLAGGREPGHYIGPDGELAHVDGVCIDCVYYDAYGRLDDLTMLEIDRQAEGGAA